MKGNSIHTASRVRLQNALWVLANANSGGDNVHRGMILGLLAGAANEEIPVHLKK